MVESRNSLPNINRRTLLAASAALGGSLLLPAQARAQAPQPRRGGTLRISMPYNPAALDPMTGRNQPDFNALYALYDALVDFDPDTLEMKPGLAKAWNFPDSTTLVMDLREGVEFHDGTPFDAEAVKFNLDRSMTDQRSNVKSDLTTVASVEVTGPHQVTLKLKIPNAGLPAILSNRAGCMLSPASVKAVADGNVDRAPVGTGPFKFVEWRDNDLIKVERNTNYWQDGQPYLDGIEFKIINELNTAARTVTAGQADIALNLAAQQIALARRDSNLATTAVPSMTVYTALYNYVDGPFGDVRIRQAANYALNREELNRVLMLGLGDPTCSIFPRSFWAADPETVDYYKHDVDKAKSLLAEAGHPNGIEIEAWGWPDQASVQRQELISSQLAQAGIRLKLTPVPPAQAMSNFFIEKRGQMIVTPTGGLPEPSIAYERMFAADALRNASKKEVDGYRPLVDATMSIFDQEERTKALHKLHRFVVEQALHLPQYMSASMAVHSLNVKDFRYGVITSPKFHTVWLDQA